MWNVGLIGTGYWSVNHLNAWERIQDVRITALCNRSSSKLTQRGEQFNISPQSLYSNVSDFLAHPDLDIVDIVTGPDTHLELVTLAAKAGKHIMCQKPFASSLEEAEKIMQVVTKYGVRLMVTENWRWLQPNQWIKRILDEGRLGRVHVARYMHTDYYTPRMAPQEELPQPFFREMPYLLFYEMGAHWFDTMRYFFGEPKRLYAEILRVSPHIKGEDTGIITLGYDDFYAVLDMSWASRRELAGPPAQKVQAEHREQIIIEGELATLKLHMNGDIVLIDDVGVETTVVSNTELDHGESHYRLQSHYIACLNNDQPFQTSGEDNLKTLNLIFSTYKSADVHEVIHFS